jgi:hypothetical protein
MTRSLRLALACGLFLAAASAPALAQPAGDKQKALDLYDKGNTQYNLGRWKQAIEFFTQAYEAYSAPEFLFNIAQAYRQDGNCSEALFFYRRYLANKPNATNKAEVDAFIKELEGKCVAGTGAGADLGTGKTGTGTGTSGTGKTGTGTSGTGSGKTGTGTSGTGTGKTGTGAGTRTADNTTITDDDEVVDDEVDDSIDTSDTAGRPKLFTTMVAAGPSFLSAGDLDTPVLAAISISAGYPLYVGTIGLEPGAMVTYTPVPWEGNMVTGTSALTGLLANLAGTIPLVPSLPALSARAELGVGVLIMNNLVQGSPFLENNQFADGAIGMFHMRFALGAEYMITRNIAVFAQPVVLSFSPASKLREDISSLTRFEVLFGAGYKM